MLRPGSAMVKLINAMAAEKQLKQDNELLMLIFVAQDEVRWQANQVHNRVIMYATRGDNWNGELGMSMPMNNPL